jgi:uncharacterized membrane protein YcgQ (UPF0703/DUF1980 family)
MKSQSICIELSSKLGFVHSMAWDILIYSLMLVSILVHVVDMSIFRQNKGFGLLTEDAQIVLVLDSNLRCSINFL